MATTANLGITKIDNTQGQAGVTANTAFDILDAALSEVAVTIADADYTLSSAMTPKEWQYGIVKATGTLTAPRNVVAPTNKKLYVFVNATTGGFAVTLKTSAGSGIAVAAGMQAILRCDGTNIVRVTADS